MNVDQTFELIDQRYREFYTCKNVNYPGSEIKTILKMVVKNERKQLRKEILDSGIIETEQQLEWLEQMLKQEQNYGKEKPNSNTSTGILPFITPSEPP